MTDDRMDAIIGNLLRTGVSVAAAVVLAGGVWYLASTTAPPAYAHFTPRVAGIRSFGALTGPEQTILAGLLILIATPVARVIFSLIAFAIECDRVYVVITLIVLLVLLYSIGTSWL
ncbi:MAG TPA: DUF1634 domain-containing protein [Candidatus Limnocylindrales bacterium]|nr:DUF1634 domain-containing protein [Candidatus Limnocylindrales bacterium]